MPAAHLDHCARRGGDDTPGSSTESNMCMEYKYGNNYKVLLWFKIQVTNNVSEFHLIQQAALIIVRAIHILETRSHAI